MHWIIHQNEKGDLNVVLYKISLCFEQAGFACHLKSNLHVVACLVRGEFIKFVDLRNS